MPAASAKRSAASIKLFFLRLGITDLHASFTSMVPAPAGIYLRILRRSTQAATVIRLTMPRAGVLTGAPILCVPTHPLNPILVSKRDHSSSRHASQRSLSGGTGRSHVAQVPVCAGAVSPVVVVRAAVAASVGTPSSHISLPPWPRRVAPMLNVMSCSRAVLACLVQGLPQMLLLLAYSCYCRSCYIRPYSSLLGVERNPRILLRGRGLSGSSTPGLK